jgi:hypothetical protein
MASLKKLQVGQSLYRTYRVGLGRTTQKTTNVSVLTVLSIHEDHAIIKVEGRDRKYFDRDLRKLLVHKPVLIESITGSRRKATKKEIDDAKAAGKYRTSSHYDYIQRR